MTSKTKKLCIVLDTNCWLSDHLLHTRLGASLVHALSQLDAILGLPEIVERELVSTWERDSRKTYEQAEKNERMLHSMIGMEDYDSTLPSLDTLLGALQERMKELDALIERVPLTLDHTRRALTRIEKHQRPSGENNEQFRDSAIWEAVLDLASKYDVHFISNDGKFYERSNPDGLARLAANLAEECERAGIKISCYRNAGSCLDALKPHVQPIPEQTLANIILTGLIKDLNEQIASAGFAVSEIKTYDVKAFPTDKPYILGVDFSLVLTLRPKAAERRDAQLVVTGECVLDSKQKTVSNPDITIGSIDWFDSDGKRHQLRKRTLFDRLMNVQMPAAASWPSNILPVAQAVGPPPSSYVGLGSTGYIGLGSTGEDLESLLSSWPSEWVEY